VTAPTRTALVTGGGRGIGRACVLALARAGFAVAPAARCLDERRGGWERRARRSRAARTACSTLRNERRSSGSKVLSAAKKRIERGAIGTTMPAVTSSISTIRAVLMAQDLLAPTRKAGDNVKLGNGGRAGASA
jgi:hypothetical protein